MDNLEYTNEDFGEAIGNLVVSAGELRQDMTDQCTIMAGFDSIRNLQSTVKAHGLEDSILSLHGDELNSICPGLLEMDRETATEALVGALANFVGKTAQEIYRLIKAMIKRIIKFIKMMLSKVRRVQATFKKLRKQVILVDYLDPSAITYNGWSWKLVSNTLNDQGGALLDVPVIDAKAAEHGGGFLNAFIFAVGKQKDVLKVQDVNRLYQYVNASHMFVRRTDVKAGYTNLKTAGIETVHTLRAALNSIESNLDLMRQFAPAVEKFEKALTFMERDYADDQDASAYVRAHGTYISSYMSTVPPILFNITDHFMAVMKQIVSPTKGDR